MKKSYFVVFIAVICIFVCFCQSGEINAQEFESGRILISSGESDPDSTKFIVVEGRGV